MSGPNRVITFSARSGIFATVTPLTIVTPVTEAPISILIPPVQYRVAIWNSPSARQISFNARAVGTFVDSPA